MATQQASPANSEKRLERVRRHAERALHAPHLGGGLRRLVDGRSALQDERQGQHGRHADEAEAEIGVAPADARDEVLLDRRPDRARNIVAGGRDRDRGASAAREPVRHIRHQGCKKGRTAEQTQDAMCQREEPERRRECSRDVAEAERDRADHDRQHHAGTIRQPPHDHAAECEAEHGQRVGEGGGPARHPELGLHRGQRHDIGPEPDIADCRDDDGRRKPQPSVTTIDPVRRPDDPIDLDIQRRSFPDSLQDSIAPSIAAMARRGSQPCAPRRSGGRRSGACASFVGRGAPISATMSPNASKSFACGEVRRQASPMQRLG